MGDIVGVNTFRLSLAVAALGTIAAPICWLVQRWGEREHQSGVEFGERLAAVQAGEQ